MSDNAYLFVHLLPGLAKSTYNGGREGKGDIQGAVQVIVTVAVEGNLNEVLDHCRSTARRITHQYLSTHPRCHLCVFAVERTLCIYMQSFSLHMYNIHSYLCSLIHVCMDSTYMYIQRESGEGEREGVERERDRGEAGRGREGGSKRKRDRREAGRGREGGSGMYNAKSDYGFNMDTTLML